VSERIRAWVDWFGLTRLVTSAVAVVTVCVGAFWLVRTPAPPSEAALPLASPAPSGPVSTLVPPSTAMDSADSGTDGANDSTDAVLVVHVAGAVVRPGVYELRSGSRVDDAIVAAGGADVGADVDLLNLAALLADGTRLYVPLVGEEIRTELVIEAAPAPTPATGSSPDGPIDVNRASASELEALPGVGPATAEAIVTERDRNGPFASVDDLDRVPGIGPAKLAALVDLVTT
jgi:competence protein ComEA